MIFLPIHRGKGCAVLGALATGLPGPFGTWTWGDQEEQDEEPAPAPAPPTAPSGPAA